MFQKSSWYYKSTILHHAAQLETIFQNKAIILKLQSLQYKKCKSDRQF